MLGLSLLSLAAVAAATAGVKHEHLHHRQASKGQYEYIVVGSGPGGGPLASRLARAGFKTLLIEAGDDQGDAEYEQVPAESLQASEYEPMSWNYYVSHYADLAQQEKDSKMVYNQTDGSLYTGQQPPEGAEPLGILYPRAGTLGGCSAHNALITVYPHENDWTNIATLTGDQSWNPAHMRTYFQKLEKCEYVPASTLGHGYDGWLHTSLTSLSLVVEDPKLLSVIVAAASAVGKTIIQGLITTVTGLAHILTDDLNSAASTRDQTLDAYQVPIAVDLNSSRRNGPRDFILDTINQGYPLDLKLTTLVTKIRFANNGTNPRAVGVEYLEGESLYAADPRYKAANGTAGYVSASKEVIISGGTFNTPQLLKLSGVGPKEELQQHGIDVVVDLPGVGTNMQDRYETTVVGNSSTPFYVSKDCTFGYTSPDPCLEAWQQGTDAASRKVYATNGIAIAIVQKSSTASETDDPDLFITGAPVDFPGYYPNYSRNGFITRGFWSWIILKAHSRNNAGTVTLRSTNPQDVPQITFNSFAGDSGDLDVQAVYEGMQFGRRAFKDLIPLAGDFTVTRPLIQDEDELKQFIRDEAWGHHACCTAAIGADNDTMAVLDSSFRVRGVDGLRVVDASVFPKIPGYYIALPIYMISEKAADVIINGS